MIALRGIIVKRTKLDAHAVFARNLCRAIRAVRVEDENPVGEIADRGDTIINIFFF